PRVSKVCEFGITPYRLISPSVGFRPAIPHRLAGLRIEPPVSEPSAAGTNPAATAAPGPLLDPPVRQSRFQGLRGGGHGDCRDGPPCANSCVMSLPMR